MVRFSTRFIAVLVTSLALLSTLVAPASAKTNGTTCHFEYNATAGNFLVSQYRGTTLTKTYATDRPPGNCTEVPSPPAPTVTLSWTPRWGDSGYCDAIVTVTGFTDGNYFVDGLGHWGPYITVIDGTGSLTGGAFWPSSITDRVYTAIVNGVPSEPSEVVC